MGEWGCLGHGVHWDTAILSYLFVCVLNPINGEVI